MNALAVLGERHNDVGVGFFDAEYGGRVGIGELQVDSGFGREYTEEFRDEAWIKSDF